ncbi:MAG: methionine--tRNA ligase [Planctomycetes bacterium]|nr:methionine--tRNA ligase [Planctomycetota bacterium]
MSRTYYVTTPIYYVNDVPHIGHSYTTIAADVLARFFRQAGRDVRFLTGTDEHGIKIVKASAEKGLTPQQLADTVVVGFEQLWRDLDITHDDFIRTSQPRHEARVQAIVQALVDRDEIYLGGYEGWYDEGQEEFVTESAARENEYKSAISGRPLVRYKEPSWFFRLGKWVPRLLEHIETHPDFILPASRANEVVSKLKMGVEDLSISRLADKVGGWGVRMPNDRDHTVYVWIDALSNYLTALGWPAVGAEDDEAHMRYWPASVHLIGKDILWFHAVYWPCMLMALDMPLPQCVFAHGWWTSEGRKMSKSLGNFISREVIAELCAEYGRDAYRYFLLREVPFGSDGDFSRASLKGRYNSELANGIGNLLSRTTNMIDRYFDGVLPEAVGVGAVERPVIDAAAALREGAEAMMARCDFHAYLGALLAVAQATNRYIEDTEPFKLAKDPDQRRRLGTILNTCAQAVAVILAHLEPFMPEVAAAGLSRFGGAPAAGTLAERTAWGALPAGTPVSKGEPLIPRKP